MPSTIDLVVQDLRLEADGVLSIGLRSADGSELPGWDFGAHIDLIMRDDLIRQYSLCSDPRVTREWRVAVLLDQASTGGSKYVHEVLRPGMLVRAMGPRNNFPLVEASQYLFIAGGIGITPFLPMVQALEAQGADWKMLYGGRRRESMAFLESFGSLAEKIEIRPEEEFGLLDLVSAIGGGGNERAIYCCGPGALIDAVIRTCETTGHEAPYFERFSGEAIVFDTSGDVPFDVLIDGTDQRFEVPIDKTIVTVLDENGIWVPTSCTEGYCGVCETVVVSGIPDHRDEYLTEEGRATNHTMMVCVGRSKTPELVLRLS